MVTIDFSYILMFSFYFASAALSRIWVLTVCSMYESVYFKLVSLNVRKILSFFFQHPHTKLGIIIIRQNPFDNQVYSYS